VNSSAVESWANASARVIESCPSTQWLLLRSAALSKRKKAMS
jgi:hypothetical protein